MKPRFWKLSHGTKFFSYEDMLDSIGQRLVYVHKDTHAKAGSSRSQGQNFLEALVGDYFYLTHGNTGIYLLGQFSAPANVFSAKGEGWLDRPFRHIKSAVKRETRIRKIYYNELLELDGKNVLFKEMRTEGDVKILKNKFKDKKR